MSLWTFVIRLSFPESSHQGTRHRPLHAFWISKCSTEPTCELPFLRLKMATHLIVSWSKCLHYWKNFKSLDSIIVRGFTAPNFWSPWHQKLCALAISDAHQTWNCHGNWTRTHGVSKQIFNHWTKYMAIPVQSELRNKIGKERLANATLLQLLELV